MPIDNWNEEGKVWEQDHGLLDEEQVVKDQYLAMGGEPSNTRYGWIRSARPL